MSLIRDQLLEQISEELRNEKQGILTRDEEKTRDSKTQKHQDGGLLYQVDDKPPWLLTLILGLQFVLAMLSSAVSQPLLFAPALCLPIDGADICNVISTGLFVSGMITILQSTFGARLPIIQGPGISFMVPMISMMAKAETKCPLDFSTPTTNLSDNETWSHRIDQLNDSDVGHIWKNRMREVQGALILASIFQALIGASGIMLIIARVIGPLTITPTISLISLGMFEVIGKKCALQWGIALLTLLAVTIYSQYMRRVTVPFPVGKLAKRDTGTDSWGIRFPIFTMFSLIFGVLTAWLVCLILTVSGVLGDTPDSFGYHARTDTNLGPLRNMAWVRLPYPGQWGMPTFSLSGTLAMITGVFVSMIDAIGDIYACARVSGAPVPPAYAMNRGLATVGVGGILSGLFGTGVGTATYSSSVAIIGITKVASRRAIQAAALFMMIFALFGKFSAIFVTIPQPIIGGMFLVIFGIVISVGLSTLQFVDLTSSRNLYVLGLSLMTGMAVPHWTKNNPDAIKTGITLLDSIVYILLTSGMFLGGFVGCVLDNTIPGTLEERGIIGMTKDQGAESTDAPIQSRDCYKFPYVSGFLRRHPWTRYIPLCHEVERDNQHDQA